MAKQQHDELNDPERSRLGADDRAHGTHGKGGSEERRNDETSPSIGHAKSSVDEQERLGSDAWGNASSGGSTFDRRPEKKGRDRE